MPILRLSVSMLLVMASSFPPPTSAAEAAQGAAAPVLPPCTCRAQGRVFDMGEEACLATPEGPRIAVCAMDQNVTSWKPTARSCPNASRRGTPA